jgi:outer membrane protein TolC
VRDAVGRRGLAQAPVEAVPAPGTDPAWWVDAATSADAGGKGMALADLIEAAARSSFQIGNFGTLPAIRETAGDEARGRFAPEVFAEARRSERDEPTSALSQTGGDSRLREEENVGEIGLRAKHVAGGEVTVSQRFSNLRSNIITYDPEFQARSRSTLGLVQPLMRGAGQPYGLAPERIADLESEAARNEFRRQAESHLLEVIRSYWVLYLARSNLAQEQRAAQAVGDLAGRLQSRGAMDAQPLQVSRARAVAAERSAGLVRAENAVRNAEAKLRALVNDPLLTDAGAPRLVPSDRPDRPRGPGDLRALVDSAMANRPEVRSAFLGYRSALLREGMAANERLPQLDMVLEGSTNGGNQGGYVFPSAEDGFRSRPSYTAGLRLSVPLGKDERDARHDRRRIETVQQALQARTTVDTVILELEVSANELATASNELTRRQEALRLANDDLKLATERWKAGLGTGAGGSDGVFYLDLLLSGQDRVTRAELDYAEAQATAMVAVANLARARGTLLADLGYSIGRDGSIPDAQPARYRLIPAAAR